MIVLLIITNLLLFVALVFACHKIETAQAETRAEMDRNAEIATATITNLSEARVLREAAADYEAATAGDPVGSANMDRLVREVYRAGGPNLPTLWLLDRAEKKENIR